MAGGYEGGASASASSGNKFVGQFGAGDVSVSTGGEKQTQTLFIVVGVVAIAGVLLAIMLLGRRR